MSNLCANCKVHYSRQGSSICGLCNDVLSAERRSFIINKSRTLQAAGESMKKSEILQMEISPRLHGSLGVMQKDLVVERDAIIADALLQEFGDDWSLSELLSSGELTISRHVGIVQYVSKAGRPILNLMDPTMTWNGRSFDLIQTYASRGTKNED